jgi:hypothetical protein
MGNNNSSAGQQGKFITLLAAALTLSPSEKSCPVAVTDDQQPMSIISNDKGTSSISFLMLEARLKWFQCLHMISIHI